MNKHKGRDRAQWRISDLASHLPGKAVSGLDPAGGTPSPSLHRLKQLAWEKRTAYLKENEEAPMKKSLFKILLVAALIFATCFTVFAATGGLEWIQRIFGDSARSIQHEIVTPQVTASADGREMAVEAAVTDGYVTNLVLSLTGSRPTQELLFEVAGEAHSRSVGWYVMEDFSTSQKTYYVLELTSESRFDTAEVSISLHGDIAPITLSFQLDNRLGNAVAVFPQGMEQNGVELLELQISPMGFLLMGREDDAKGGLPATDITLVFHNGNTEQLEVEFSPSDETVGGGGGAIMGGGPQELPLVVGFYGTRNPDGELIVTGQFSRVINPAQIQEVVIEGSVYPVQPPLE